MKRLADLLLSLLVLLLFLPLGLVLSVLILATSRGGVFFLQERVGRNGAPFQLIKFRTMKKDAQASGRLTVGTRDPRITGVGSFLRKFKLDEIPQFLNVLKGDMSIVGPRPEVREYVDLYSPDQREVLDVRPGITDYASIEYARESELLEGAEDPEKTYVEVILPAKIQLNRKYLDNPSMGQYFKIIWLTFLRVIR